MRRTLFDGADGQVPGALQEDPARRPPGPDGPSRREPQGDRPLHPGRRIHARPRRPPYGRKPDPAPLQAFIKKYPESKLVKNAYGGLAYYYGYQAPKDDAGKFFEEYTAKFPDDKDALGSYVQRIIKDKEPLDKGIALADKLKELAGYPRNPDYQQNLAQLYALKDDAAKADEEYGKDFVDDYVTTAIYALIGYANFWIDQDKNLDSAEETADILAPPRSQEGRPVLLPLPGRRDLRQAQEAREGPGRLRSGDRQEELGRSGVPFELRQLLEPSGDEPRQRPRRGQRVRRAHVRLLQQLRPGPGPVQAEELSRGPQGRGKGRRARQAHGRRSTKASRSSSTRTWSSTSRRRWPRRRKREIKK